MIKKWLLLFIVISISTTWSTKKAVGNVEDEFSSNFHANFINGFTEQLCGTSNGLSCIGMLKDECKKAVFNYASICKEQYPTKIDKDSSNSDLKKAGGILGNCIMKQRLDSNVNLHKINMESCKALSQKGKQLIKKGEEQSVLINAVDTHKESDFKHEHESLLKAAENGNSEAQYRLGSMYISGFRAEKNYEQAIFWFHKAAEQGNAGAQSDLGFMYSEGLGVKRDAVRAFEWYKKSAVQEDVSGQYNLASLYRYGDGVDKNQTKAIEWFRKAAEKNNAPAILALAEIYSKGEGIKQDNELALSYYLRAAKLNNEKAMRALGWMYNEGKIVERNSAESLRWYKLAAGLDESYPVTMSTGVNDRSFIKKQELPKLKEDISLFSVVEKNTFSINEPFKISQLLFRKVETKYESLESPEAKGVVFRKFGEDTIYDIEIFGSIYHVYQKIYFANVIDKTSTKSIVIPGQVFKANLSTNEKYIEIKSEPTSLYFE